MPALARPPSAPTRTTARPDHDWRGRSGGNDLPAGDVDIDVASAFCQRLSQRDQLNESEWCYWPETESGVGGWRVVEDYLKRTGYRIPTDEEWLYVARCGTTAEESLERRADFLNKIGWFFPLSHPLLTTLNHCLAVSQP